MSSIGKSSKPTWRRGKSGGDDSVLSADRKGRSRAGVVLTIWSAVFSGMTKFFGTVMPAKAANQRLTVYFRDVEAC